MRTLLIAAIVAGSLTLGVPAALGQQTSTLPPIPDAPGIIPKPNSGVQPQEAGDRGGALQIATFVLIFGGVGVIGLLVVRDARKARSTGDG